MSLKPIDCNNTFDCGMNDAEYSFHVDKTEKDIKKWAKVYENKEKLSTHYSLGVKSKLDKQFKRDRTKAKK